MFDPIAEAVSHFWRTRDVQSSAQTDRGRSDAGTRGAATGGKQMDRFLDVFRNTLESAGVPADDIFERQSMELPGYFRPTKKWDLLVVHDGKLIAAIEVKSQVGPSFGNNFNNRCEEALGSAQDIWTAYRERAFGAGAAPWLGYMFLLEDCDRSNSPVRVDEPHFEVFEEFRGQSYVGRYKILCERLRLERLYTGVAFLTSDRARGDQGAYNEPHPDLTIAHFLDSLAAHTRSVLR